MYRARAESVSGTHVYADGKWLKCIGNKCVSVGDYIWTDGRCVYGHLQESEQPKVITAQEDEGIPIVMSAGEAYGGQGTYTFEKNKLKEAPPPEDMPHYEFIINDRRGNVFGYAEDPIIIDAGDKSETYQEILAANIDGQGNHYYLVNEYTKHYDDKGNLVETRVDTIKILKNGTEIKSVSTHSLQSKPFPTDIEVTPSSDEMYQISEEDASIDTYVLNAFIEDENRWSCVLQCDFYKGFTVYGIRFSSFYGFTPTDVGTEGEYLIFRMENYGYYFYGSEAVLHAIQNAVQEQARAVLNIVAEGGNPESVSIPIEYNVTQPEDTPYYNRYAEITFNGTTCVISGHRTRIYAAASVLGLDDIYPYVMYWEDNYCTYVVMLSSDTSDESGENILLKYTGILFGRDTIDRIPLPDYCENKQTYEYPDVEKATFLLHDGYYYKMHAYPDYDWAHDGYGACLVFVRDFFSSANKKLFSYTADLVSQSVVAKIKSGYLLGTRSNVDYAGRRRPNFAWWFSPYITVDYPDLENQWEAYDGLFLYKNEQWQRLEGGMCINERLRPMKKIKNWQKRIREITLSKK